MRNFQDTFETRKQSLVSAFSICMTVPLSKLGASLLGNLLTGKGLIKDGDGFIQSAERMIRTGQDF